jgi:RNA polymerase sigma factor (TIGR02999 family)
MERSTDSCARAFEPSPDVAWSEIYDELRRLAAVHLRRERAGHTLQATALVHEAYLRLAHCGALAPAEREHLFALASTTIRRILVDHARARAARSDGLPRLEPADERTRSRELELLELDEALHELARLNPRQARVVKLRHFGALSIDDCARVLGVSPRTVDSLWSAARAWLARRLRAG